MVLVNKARKALANFKQAGTVGNGNSPFRLVSSLGHARKVNQAVPNSFGAKSDEELNIISEILIKENSSITKANIKEINNALNNIPFTEAGGFDLLDDAVDKGNMTSTQRDLAIMQHEEMKTAKSEAEMLSIADTFEYEVANSEISNAEKRLLLVNSAMTRNLVLDIETFGTAQYRKTAIILAPLLYLAIVVATVTAGYLIGDFVAWLACPFINVPYNECEDTFQQLGMAIALVFVV